MKPGLYELLINEDLQNKLKEIKELQIEKRPVDRMEARRVLSKYLADIVEKGLTQIAEQGDDSSLEQQVTFLNKLIAVVKNEGFNKELCDISIPEKAEELLALLQTKKPFISGKVESIRPRTNLSKSTILTAITGEPQLASELKKEISSSDRIDMLVSFVKWTGLRTISDELKEFVNRGGKLRLITTSYMGATDPRAIEELSSFPNTEIKISYDTKRTRLHAKAYIFYRDTGFHTAYVGSSNLSNVAMTSGTEWNVKVTVQDLPDTFAKITGTFESYWNNENEYLVFNLENKGELEKAIRRERNVKDSIANTYAFDISPYIYQQEILDRLAVEREVHGSFKNLIVAATGTGKTVIAAFDYKRFCKEAPKASHRLLFVAHRQEILKQSRECFRGILRDPNFGELYVGDNKPQKYDYLFVSVQTLNAKQKYESIAMDYYDYIVVDETHHGAAPSYLNFLNHFKPKLLLGLTATPERLDGKDILGFFNNRIAAEIRLPEAIERKLLCPFQYFGVTDTVDFSNVKWEKGKYDINDLNKFLVLDEAPANKRASMVIDAILKYVTDVDMVKGLGFCASVEHAEFMEKYFIEHQIPSIHLDANSSDEVRNTAKQKLESGEIKFIFVVDLYNEGVDIHEINTILFLRPTESLTVFLQQLGRGLRLCEGKECLTVLDFIGHANKKYSFAEKFIALLANTKNGLKNEIEGGFADVPSGCYIKLEAVAQKHILENITLSLQTKDGLISRMKTFEEDTGMNLDLKSFTDYYKISPKKFYVRDELFSDYRVLAFDQIITISAEGNRLRKKFYRLACIDSAKWLAFLLDTLPTLRNKHWEQFSTHEQRMLKMFAYSISNSTTAIDGIDTMNIIARLLDEKECFAELMELLEYNKQHIETLPAAFSLDEDCPLELHCSYSKDQIIAAMDEEKNPSSVRQGVLYFEKSKTDVFFVTLNKSQKDYSPSTFYNDYAINSKLFHWQSQSTTKDTSPTAQRYINQQQTGNKICLFVRERNKDDNKQTCNFTFLGLMNYVSHTGSEPMNITWRMETEIPAKFLKELNRLIVG